MVNIDWIPAARQDFAAKFLKDGAELDAAVNSGQVEVRADLRAGTLYKPLKIVSAGVAQDAALEELEAWFHKFPWIHPEVMDWNDFQANFVRAFPRNKPLGVRLDKIQIPFFHAKPQDIKRTVQLLAPHLHELAEIRDVWFVAQSMLVSKRLAAVRILHAAKDFPDMMNVPVNQFGGFQTLERLQATSELGTSTEINFVLSLFTPLITGFSQDQIGGSYVYILNEPKAYTVPFPPRLQDLVRSDGKVLKEDRSLAEVEAEARRSWTFTPAQLESLFLNAVDLWGALQAELLNPLRFADTTGALDIRRWHLTYSTVARLFVDATSAQTEYLTQYPRKLMAFRVLDAISQVLAKNPASTVRNETDIFKRLLSRGVLRGKIGNELSQYPAPFGNLLRNRNREMTEDIYGKVLAGVFVPGARSGRQVRVGTGQIAEDDFVQAFLREVRNTQHGYNIHRFEVIQVHNGSVPDSLGELAKYFLLAWLRSPDLVLNATILS